MLKIETFTNTDLSKGWRPGNNAGGSTLFKALGHPLAARKGRALVAGLAENGPVALYDPSGVIGNFHAYFDLGSLDIEGYYVQRIEDLGSSFAGLDARPVTAITQAQAATILVLLFDADKVLAPIQHLFPEGARVKTLDEMRLPETMLTNKKNYLDPLNFATNFALMRDQQETKDAGALHTTLTSANYWSVHGAKAPRLWLCLFDEEGNTLADWIENLPGQPGSPFILDSQDIRKRFDLCDFSGSLFIHAVNIAGHDVVKYALDVYGNHGRNLTCTHDANAWPADYYAGMPAGEEDEEVLLYIQNSHPMTIPPNSIGLNIVGAQDHAWYPDPVPAFATRTLRVPDMLPEARWPDQIEITAGRFFVRPRYEVIRKSPARRRIAHANVERTDLKPDPHIPRLAETAGKGYIMPLPVLPRDVFHTVVLPTPMARSEMEIPVRADLFDANGVQAASRYLGRIPRRESVPLDIEQWLSEEKASLSSGYGHVEILYDFREGGEANGWLHALGRFEQKASGHRAETIFGAHIYNTPVIYRDEPQSYIGRPPGLTTRLFLRLGHPGLDTMCHLVYPASLPWHEKSSTQLILHNAAGEVVAQKDIHIPCGGSHFWRYREVFSEEERAQAEKNGMTLGYVIVRDTTCRLFGFHGLINANDSFCLDHMFGF